MYTLAVYLVLQLRSLIVADAKLQVRERDEIPRNFGHAEYSKINGIEPNRKPHDRRPQRLQLLALARTRERENARGAPTMCTAMQVRSLGPSQLAQGAMPALAAALRVALLGRLALASAVPIGGT